MLDGQRSASLTQAHTDISGCRRLGDTIAMRRTAQLLRVVPAEKSRQRKSAVGLAAAPRPLAQAAAGGPAPRQPCDGALPGTRPQTAAPSAPGTCAWPTMHTLCYSAEAAAQRCATACTDRFGASDTAGACKTVGESNFDCVLVVRDRLRPPARRRLGSSLNFQLDRLRARIQDGIHQDGAGKLTLPTSWRSSEVLGDLLGRYSSRPVRWARSWTARPRPA